MFFDLVVVVWFGLILVIMFECSCMVMFLVCIVFLKWLCCDDFDIVVIEDSVLVSCGMVGSMLL